MVTYNRTERIILFFGVLVLSFLFFLPLLLNEFPWTHEQDAYGLRLLSIGNSLRDTGISYRWLETFARGYGYPFFNFYAPGIFFLCIPFQTVGISVVSSLKIAVVLTTLLGTAGMFMLGCFLWRSHFAGGLVALIWTFFPYRILNLYIRGDLAELAAMSLLPWIVYGHLRIIRGGSKWSILLASISHGALLWTHNITALIFHPFLIVFDIFFVYIEKGWRRSVAGSLIASHVLALGFSTAFWLPALLEKKYVYIDALTQTGTGFEVQKHLLWGSQLLKPGWGWGLSVEGPKDSMSFQLGLATLIGAALGVCAGMRRRSSKERDSLRVAVLVGLVLIILFLTLRYSVWFWKHVPLARFVQFPWRLLSLASLPLSLLVGPFGTVVETRSWKIKYLAALTCAVVVPLLVLGYCKPKEWRTITDDTLKGTFRKEFVTTTFGNEYLPVNVPFNYHKAFYSDQWGGELEIIDGEGSIFSDYEKGDVVSRRFRIHASTDVNLRWAHFFFPGWMVRVNDEWGQIHPSSDGEIMVNLSSGDHRVEFIFAPTLTRFWAGFVSQLTLVATLGLIYYIIREKSRKKKQQSVHVRMAVNGETRENG